MPNGTKPRVEVVAYEDVSQLLPGGSPVQRTADLDKLLEPLYEFAERAGTRLNDMVVPPSAITVEGHVSVGVGGNILFGVDIEAGISVSITWEFETVTGDRAGRRCPPPPPPPAE